MADVALTAYEFAVTDGTEARTLPDRLAEAMSVKDFGAVGDGVTDDWEAIRDCLDRSCVELTVAVASPFVPDDATRATFTASRTGNAVSSFTITNGGTNYAPSTTYSITISGGGGTGATGTATTDGSGVFTSTSVTAGGSGYTSDPTCTMEYPGFNTTITFDSVPGTLITLGYEKYIYALNGTTYIDSVDVVSFDTVAKTVLLRSRTDGSLTPSNSNAVVRNADLEVGDVVRFVRAASPPTYFPPGIYRVSEPILLNGDGRSFHLYGDGKISKIVGNFDDYILKRNIPYPSSSAQSGNRQIERLAIENEHATGGGINIGQSVGCAIHDCHITANRGINTFNQDEYAGGAPWGSFEMIVSNCYLTPGSGRRTGSQGLAMMHDGPTINCVVYDYEIGWLHTGGQGGQIVAGCRFEQCDVGCRHGILPDLVQSHSALFFGIVGNTFKNCGTAILNPRYFIGGNYIFGAEAGITGDPQYGLRCQGNAVQITTIWGNYVEGWYDIASFYVDGSEANRSRTLYWGNYCSTNTNGAATNGTWRNPTSPTGGEFLECNTAVVYTFANLPANTTTSGIPNRHEGECWNISNSNTATYGATAAAGGTDHVKIRFNNSKAPIVIGK